MFAAFLTRTSRIAISGRLAEWRHRVRTQQELMTLGEYERGSLPFFAVKKAWPVRNYKFGRTV